MWILSPRMHLVGVLFSLGVASSASGQIVPKPNLGFEFTSWGDTPSAIESLFGYTWLRTYGNQENKNLGSGRNDVFSRPTETMEFGTRVFVQFEFTDSDSGLVAATMIAGGLPGMYEVDEDFVDRVWEMNHDRFGEPSGGKWIPLIGESKEWMIGDVFIKMIRMNLPTTGILVKYVLQEENDTKEEEVLLEGDLRR